MAGDKAGLKGLNILSIDGGGIGIGGLSSLFVLDEIMRRLHELEDGQKPPKPADHFDVIAGTGAGGVSACMLGRLGMSTHEAIKASIKLADTGFSRKYISTSGRTIYKGTALRNALKAMVHDAVGDENAAMQTENSEERGCKTMVFAMSKHHIDASVPALFRSYPQRRTDTAGYSIWEALYATMAHPDLFKSIDIVYDSISQPFICAELGCGNPIAHTLAEVGNLYPDRHVSCILSIGSGQARIVHIPKPNLVQRVLQTSNQIATAVRDMATGGEDVKEKMAVRFQYTTQLYYRFNVDQGLQATKGDWEQQSEIRAHTTAYMGKVEVGQMMNHVVKSVKDKANVLPVKYIDGTIQVPGVEEVIVIKECPAPNPVFTGREDLVRRVGNCIAGNANERRVCVIHGMGGAGKTQIALKAIELNREVWEHVLYVDASSKKAIEGAFSDVAKARELGKTFQDALNWLGSCHKPWLLILDSADDPSVDIYRYFPRGDHGSVLITTRRPALGVLGAGPDSIFQVSEMSETDALALFFKAARVQASSVDAEEMEATYALLKEFGYLALAIVQAGAYIAFSLHISIPQYLQLFLEQRQRMLEQYIALGALVKLDDYGRSVYTTLQLCYDLLRENGDARSTLWLIAYLHHDDIRPDIFRRAAVNVRSYTPLLHQTPTEQAALQYLQRYLSRFLDPDGNWDPTRFSNAMNELGSYSLVEFDRVNQTYRMHVLVQEWARGSNPQEQELALECSTRLLSLSVDGANTTESLAFTRNLRRHLEALLPKDLRQLYVNHAWGFGQVYVENGNLDQAEELQMRLLEVAEQQLGEEHPVTLNGMNDLAHTYQSKGQWEKAQSLLEQVLDARKRVLGEEHPHTLGSMGNLAVTYQSQGQWQKAQSLQGQLLDSQKRLLGEEHPDTLASMTNLAAMYQSQGQLDNAQLLHEKVLNSSKRVLGEEHPTTLISMNNLAAMYSYRGQWDKAHSLHEQILNVRKRVLGEEHPHTLKSMDNLAATHQSRGQWDKAQLLHEQALDAYKRVLGEEHPDTLGSMNNLAAMYQSRGELNKAESLHEQILNARQRVLGEEHPDTLKTMINLALVSAQLGRFGESERLAAAVDARKHIVGEQHEIAVRARALIEWLQARNTPTAAAPP